MKLPEKRPTRQTRALRAAAPKPTIEARLLNAMEALLRKGHRFGAVSVELLMEEAGLSRATFYRHFKDRGELVSRLMESLKDELMGSTGRWLADAANASRKDVEDGLLRMVEVYAEHHVLLSAINDIAPQDNAVAELYVDLVEALCKQARASLRVVKRAGRSRAGASDEVADVMTWMVALYCTRFAGARDGPELARMQKAIGYICGSVVFADTRAAPGT